MAEVVLHSFAELAKFMGKSKPSEMKVSESAFDQVESKCGRKAAIVWAWRITVPITASPHTKPER